MKNHARKIREARAKIDRHRYYEPLEAFRLAKDLVATKFDPTMEVAFRLNVDPKKADQQIRGAVVLPAGTGKKQRILVVTSTKAKEAEAAGADVVGGTEIIEKIKKGWFDFDVMVATPEIMAKLGTIGKILGPRGLMPNPKSGTVTMDVVQAINEIRKGKVEYRTDKEGNVHSILGKASFTEEQLFDNFRALLDKLIKAKPQTVKGDYILNVSISTTMGPGIKVSIPGSKSVSISNK